MKFTPYSFSKINLFETCPLKFKYQYIDKLRTPFKMNATLEKGSYIHLMLEELAKNEMVAQKVSYNFKHSTKEQVQGYNAIFHDFVFSELGYHYLNNPEQKFFGAEVEFGVVIEDGEWRATSYWNKKALFRGKIDHVNSSDGVMHLLDWKSGKVSAFPAPLQLVMYAVWCFLKYPDVHTVQTAFVYLEHGEEKPYVFKREHLEALMKKVAEKIYNIEHETKFTKKESKLCDYCEFRLQGICESQTGTELADDMMKFNPKPRVKLWFYMHPESGCAWRQDWQMTNDEHDELTEEIDEELFWQLEDLGYDIDRNILSKA